MFAASRALRKLTELPQGERALLLQAALLLPAVHLVQTVLPFRRWRALLTTGRVARVGSSPSPTTSTTPTKPSPRQIAQAIERARKGVPGIYKCLPQAYAGHLMLRRYGYPSLVQVGVARDPKGAVEAHAWVELEGKVLIGELADLARFVPLPELKV